jgi:hypothetical protein
MDQAMADSSIYFQNFYKDLVDKRFVLIVNEPSNYNHPRLRVFLW